VAVEALASLVDAIIGILAWIAGLFLRLVASCIRSLRYAFSPSYRRTVDERLQERGSIHRAAYASWGVVAVVACIVAVAAIISWIATPEPTPAEVCSKVGLRELSECVRALREALQQ